MKSIKEKTEEYAPYTGKDSWSRIQKCIIAQISFEAGANYVLRCVEDIIVNNEDNTLNIARCLVDCIEQLKK
jgi:hypothetical protein